MRPQDAHSSDGYFQYPAAIKVYRGGYTLIEMIIVTFILLLMAAMIMPNVVSMARSRALYARESMVSQAPLEAKNEAVRSQMPVAMRVDGSTLVMERIGDKDDRQTFKTVDLGNDLQVAAARNGSASSDLASWTWTVYPDGSSDTGGLTFAEGNLHKSLVFASNGKTQWIPGDLPDASDEQWQAGQLQQRGN